MSDLEQRRIPVAGDVELAVDVDGSGVGAPVVLVHGLASNARLWDGVAAELRARDHPVAIVDQRNHGRSGKPGAGHDFATVTADLASVIEALGWERPVVAGQSWGGNVVVELAARHPGATRGIVGVDGGFLELAARFPDWAAAQQALSPPDVSGTTLAELEEWLRRRHPDWDDTAVGGALACYAVLDDGTARPWLDRADHLAILRHLWEHRPSTLFADLPVPALLLVADDPAEPEWTEGKRRDVAAVEAATAGGRRGAGLRVIWVRGDHDLHAQQPGVVAQAVHDAVTDGFFP